jgi:hypothetical protein
MTYHLINKCVDCKRPRLYVTPMEQGWHKLPFQVWHERHPNPPGLDKRNLVLLCPECLQTWQQTLARRAS